MAIPSPDNSPTGTVTEGETGDVSANLGLEYEVDVPEVAAAATTGVAFNRSGTIRVPTTHDTDAEDEAFTLAFTAQVGGGADIDTTAAGGTAIALPAAGMTGNPNALTIDDDETQSYVLSLMDPTAKPKEGDMVVVSVKADPAHEDRATELSLNIDRPAPDYGVVR